MDKLRDSETRDFFVGDYKVLGKFDQGSFGEIFLGESLYTGERVAIKVEKAGRPYPQLAFEHRVYRTMKYAEGLPKFLYFCEEDDYSAIVMELLGPSLDYLFQFCSRTFTLRTVLLLADEMLLRLEYVHGRGFIHRDIKPQNFLIGRDVSYKRVHLIDFGLAKKYWDPNTQVHIPYREDCSLTGTARYASIGSHEGIEQSRRDDLVSVGYVLIYFLHGHLPWQDIKASTKRAKYERIHQLKCSISNEQLCKDLPSEFTMYLNYCYKLSFDAKPNYTMLRKMFQQLHRKMYPNKTQIYDWEMLTLKFHSNQANPGTGNQVAAVKCQPDDGFSGYPIIKKEPPNS